MPKGYIYRKLRSSGPGPDGATTARPTWKRRWGVAPTWDGTGTKAIAIPRRSYIRAGAARRMRLPCLIR